jgi:hypothetical protein
VVVSYLPCPACKQPHDRREPCAVEGVTLEDLQREQIEALRDLGADEEIIQAVKAWGRRQGVGV